MTEIERAERRAFLLLVERIAEQHKLKGKYVSTDKVFREAKQIAEKVEREKLSTIYRK